MNLENVLKDAEEWRRDENNRVIDAEEPQIGEGANKSAYLSPRGYVVKPVAYDSQSEDPFYQTERLEDIDRFPWIEVDERDQEGPFNYALVNIDRADLTHEEAVDTAHFSDIIHGDLNMFFDLRSDNITYRDFKPDNIGYFWQNQSLVAMPIDVIDNHAWEEEENLLYRRFSDIMDVYVRGTPNEDGLTDLYPISVPEAEEHILNYLGLDTTDITGDPYKDLFQVLDESQENLEEVLE